MTREPSYHLAEDARFVVEDYNWAKPFSNFLPGIAGRWGMPAWTYYVSRGQAVCGLGVADKNGQILEFSSFNKACLEVARQGFRTFLRVDGQTYEPFLWSSCARRASGLGSGSTLPYLQALGEQP